MNTVDAIKERRSIRRFTSQTISHELLEKIINLAAYAPSWKNTQITRYTAIENEELKNKIADEFTNEFNAATIHSAPVLMAVTVVKKRCGFERDGSYSTKRGATWQMFDAGAASQTFCLAAHEYGVGSVIMGIFDEEGITNLLEIPEDRELVALIPIGYPNEAPAAPKRKTAVDLLEYK